MKEKEKVFALLMAPGLLQNEGKAFDNYIIHDRKMLAQSPELLDSACVNIEKFHPQVVLITGDLTPVWLTMVISAIKQTGNLLFLESSRTIMRSMSCKLTM